MFFFGVQEQQDQGQLQQQGQQQPQGQEQLEQQQQEQQPQGQQQQQLLERESWRKVLDWLEPSRLFAGSRNALWDLRGHPRNNATFKNVSGADWNLTYDTCLMGILVAVSSNNGSEWLSTFTI